MKIKQRVHYADEPETLGTIQSLRRVKKTRGGSGGGSYNTGHGTALVEITMYGVEWDRDPGEIDWLYSSQIQTI